jgi:hypothetical protein
MAKNVTSRDPRKPFIVAALKRKAQASKVTLLVETTQGGFQGNCLAHGRTGYQTLGTFTVTRAEVVELVRQDTRGHATEGQPGVDRCECSGCAALRTSWPA